MLKKLLKRLLPESLRRRSRSWRGAAIAALAQRTNLTREPFSFLFLHGEGLEIGSLNWPLPVPRDARVRYADRATTEELRKAFPQFADTLLPVSVVTRAETLEGVADDRLDFVIANHVVEHTEDPIGAIRNLLRVIKEGGIVFLTLPDKRFTFDHERPLTPFEHLRRDYEEGPEGSRLDHYREMARYLEGITDPDAIERRARQAAAEGADTHFHVWTQAEMMEMLVRVQRELGFRFDVEAMSKTGLEAIFVLRKTGPVPPPPDRLRSDASEWG